MPIYSLGDFRPIIDPTAFIAPTAVIIGKVRIGRRSSVWPNAVLRGDEEGISLGEECNVQDNCTLHTDPGYPVEIGDGVSIGHNAVVHGAKVEEGCLIGMGAILLNGARIGRGSFIAAGALVREGDVIPPRSLVLGVPGRVARQVDEELLERMRSTSRAYLRLSELYARLGEVGLGR